MTWWRYLDNEMITWQDICMGWQDNWDYWMIGVHSKWHKGMIEKMYDCGKGMTSWIKWGLIGMKDHAATQMPMAGRVSRLNSDITWNWYAIGDLMCVSPALQDDRMIVMAGRLGWRDVWEEIIPKDWDKGISELMGWLKWWDIRIMEEWRADGDVLYCSAYLVFWWVLRLERGDLQIPQVCIHHLLSSRFFCIIGLDDGCLQVYNWYSDQLQCEIEAHSPGQVTGLMCDPENQYIISAGKCSQLSTLDAEM